MGEVSGPMDTGIAHGAMHGLAAADQSLEGSPLHPRRASMSSGRSLLIVAALLLCGKAFAAPGDPLACMPAEWGGSGTYFAMVKNADGVSAAWGCPPNGMISSIKVLNDFAPTLASCPKSVADLTATVFDNSASLEVARKILATCGAVPAVGTPRRAVYDELEALATAAVQAKYRAAHPLPPPGEVWKSAGSSLFLYSNGKLTGVISGQHVPAGLDCDCTVSKATSKSSAGVVTTYCALVGKPPQEVAACLRQP